MMSSRPVIHWFRRDLRLEDNTALYAALGSGHPVLPVFIFDPAILNSPNTGAPRVKFLLKALQSLHSSLRERGSGLLIRHGSPDSIIPQLVTDFEAAALYYNHDYTTYARKRDTTVNEVITIPIHSHHDILLLSPGEVMKADGTPYTVFTPFKKTWLTIPKAATNPTQITGQFYQSDSLNNVYIPSLAEFGFGNTIDVPDASEQAASTKLDNFLSSRVFNYAEARDSMADTPEYGTSRLSPYFRFGILSIRTGYWRSRDAYDTLSDTIAQKSIETWVSELIWRDFYHHILYHFPHVQRGNFRYDYDELLWRDVSDELAVWQSGHTGYPVVDAAMRQLQGIGWMHNRARMIVASFLTKDLLIDWRHGERHFMRWLIDGDVAANNGGWQWAAGTGTDAQPYFRIFNPVSQSKKFDPHGMYIRRWIPELRAVPDQHIHEPWTMDTPPTRYPAPIVDHQFARQRALSVYKAARESANS